MESSFGTSSDARKKRVYYTGTDTIYEGMPLCYEFDATDNVLGYDKGAGGDVVCQTTPETTAEGNQNEGKFILVEDVAADNIQWFAGVVAGNSYGGMIGPRWLDIYIPNGAIVPVRTDLSCTVGRTVLTLVSASQELTGSGRPVAIAEETVDRSGGDDGIVLAKLDVSLFAYQKNGSNNLLLTSTSAGILNDIRCDFAHTSGNSANFLIYTTLSSALASDGGICSAQVFLGIDGTITATTSYTRAVLAQLNLAGTINGSNVHLTGLHAQLSGTPTFTECAKVSGLWVDCVLGVAPSTGDYVGIRISNNGANQSEVLAGIELYGGYGINRLFNFDTCDGITANFISNGGTGGAEIGITSGGDWKKLKIAIDGSIYYMIAMIEPVEVDMVS